MKRWWLVVVIVIVLVLVGGGAAVYVDWTWKRKLSPRGGRPFLTRIELPVPSFQQGDAKWRDDPLGGVPENGTLGGEGCAVAAAAMVFKFYGVDVDPQQLNWFLRRPADTRNRAGFTGIAQHGSRPIACGMSTKTCLRIN